MPLIGRKIFDAGSFPSEKHSSEKTYVIPHTNEVFDSEREYNQRLKLYGQKIWSCQCTGHNGLTHEEATKSEISSRKRLANFSEVWEAPILSSVHHSYAPLDTIVLQVHQMLMTKLIQGEKVKFSVNKPEKTFEATIVKRYDLTGASSSESEGNNKTIQSTSPSSDKENKTRQALITDVFKTDARRSPRCPSLVMKNDSSKRKLQLLPAKYDILLSDENKIVSKVPHEHLTRVEKPPNKESIRLFIRSNAIRLWGGKDKLPWIVSDDMVFRHSLKARITPEKEKEACRLSTVPHDQLLLDVSGQLKHQSSGNLPNGDPLTNGIGDKTDEDDVSLAQVKKKRSVFEKVSSLVGSKKRKLKTDPIVKVKRLKKEKLKKLKSSNSKGKPSGMDLFLKKMGKPASQSCGDEVEMVVIDDDDEDDKPLSSRFQINSSQKSPKKSQHSASSRKNTNPKKKKQATLLELTKKGSGIKVMGSPSNSLKLSPSKPRKPRQPLIILQLMSLKKEKKFRAHKYKMTVTAACKILTEKQRENLPLEVKDDVMTKWEMEEKRRKFQAMSADEKRAYLAEQRKAKRENENRASFPKKDEKYEDLHLTVSSTKTLPDLELIGLPESIPNTTFADMAMLCEFLHSYHSLLCPKDPSFHKQFNIQTLADAVTAGKTGFRVTRKILVLFLQTLLLDDVAQDYCELDFPLKQISVTPEVSCELTRVCLRQHDDELDDESESGSNPDGIDTGLSDSTSRRLFEMELYEMHPVEQIEVMSTLAYRVMNTYAVQTHMDEMMMKATTIWKKVIKQGVERKKEEKELEQELKEKGPNTNGSEIKDDLAEAKESEIHVDVEKDIDLVSRVKQRKLLSAQYKKEEAERKEKRRKEQDEEMLKQKSRQEREKTKRQLAETRMLAVHVRRRVPLGTDRNHSRYWLFCDGVPGLYIEKGWIGDHIDYCTNPDFQQLQPSSPSKMHRKSVDSFDFGGLSSQQMASSPQKSRMKSTNSSDDDLPLSQLNTPTKKKGSRFRKSKEEASWPRPGQNMWMSVDSEEELDNLMKSLCQNGIRESKLHRTLEKNYDIIMRSISKKNALFEKTAEPLARRSALPAEGDQLLKSMATKHLQTLIRDACRGGLAVVDEPDIFEQRIATLENVSQFSASLLEIFDAIPKKFFKRYVTGIPDKKKKGASESTDAEQLVSEREKVKAENRVSKWKQAVEDVTLYSRFCFLLAILNDSIKWEMYEYRRINARRRVARNKNYVDTEEVEETEEEEAEEEAEEEEGVEEDGSDEEEADDSDDDEPQRRSSRIKEKRKAKQTEVMPSKRTRRRTTKYRIESSDEEDEESDQEEEDESTEEDVLSSNKEAESSDDSSNDNEEEGSDLDDGATVCRNIVEKLMKYQYTDIFRDPVDAEDVPDYYDIITNPISLCEILDKIETSEKAASQSSDACRFDIMQLMDDIRQLLDNAHLYNAEDSYAVKQANKLESAFVRLCRDSITDTVKLRRLRNVFKGASR